MQSQTVKKMMTFPVLMYQVLEKKAERLGLQFPEYIRYLGMKDIEEEVKDMPLVSEETEKAMGESYEAYKKGDYIALDPLKDRDWKKKLLEFGGK